MEVLNLEIKYLNYIITIANERNMTKAAEKLFVSQSSLSYYLSKLEQELGTPLFFRQKNELLPTPAGRLYLEAAHEVVATRERLYQNIFNLKNKSHIVISTTSQWGDKMFSDIIPSFKKSFPDATFELTRTEIFFLGQEIQNGKIDFALISVGSMADIDESMEILRKEEMFFAVPKNHPYVLSHPETTIKRKNLVTDFYGDTFLLSRKGSANRVIADRLFAEYAPSSIPPQICTVNGLSLTCNMVAQNVGVALMPLSGKSMEDEIHYYTIIPKLYRYNVLLHKKNLIFNQPEQAFFDLAKNYFKNQAGADD